MDKMPDRITDEVISNDPADVPDAVDKEYDVYFEVNIIICTTVSAENEILAIEKARKNWTRSDISEASYDDEEAIEQ